MCDSNELTDDENVDEELQTLKETVYDLIRGIKDPEKIETLEELNVVTEEGVEVKRFSDQCFLIRIEFIPTVPHCTLASLIGLCMRNKLQRDFPELHKLDIFVKEGSHDIEEDINRQINDKERIAAAMENPKLRELVTQCVDFESL
ncbi:Hypothetical predicted protein [Octopus vulgaris]|uniref:Uncharacterized protein n=2 Tax=Octopus TaxID=6643 RepID=A0AA36F9I5_OCTVU|nr:cytosolic iron-sulfur assembly component 2A-like [Octopus sinensis]CAI9729199.1 Hypothetical predicted protein [Octopus vulgaris]